MVVDRTEFNAKHPVMDQGSQVQGMPAGGIVNNCPPVVIAPSTVTADPSTLTVVNQSGQSSQVTTTGSVQGQSQGQGQGQDRGQGQGQDRGQGQTDGGLKWIEASHIIRKRLLKGQLEFFIKFKDNSVGWCLDEGTGMGLKTAFFAREAQKRRRRAKLRRDAFRN